VWWDRYTGPGTGTGERIAVCRAMNFIMAFRPDHMRAGVDLQPAVARGQGSRHTEYICQLQIPAESTNVRH
jgi:hypothetical protein